MIVPDPDQHLYEAGYDEWEDFREIIYPRFARSALSRLSSTPLLDLYWLVYNDNLSLSEGVCCQLQEYIEDELWSRGFTFEDEYRNTVISRRNTP